jgi:diacylglycerol kinase family enzyme
VVTVFLNPAAGGRQPQDLAAQLAAQFDAAGSPARIITLDSIGHVQDAVRSALAAGAGTVVAAGGDGTVSSIASALFGADVSFGVLPLGTLNHFAKDLGIPVDLEAAVWTVAHGRSIAVDLGEVNGRLFLNNSSIGIYPDIVLEREALRERGYRKWTALALATSRVLSRYPGLIVRVTAADATQLFRTPFLFVGNNEYEVEGIRVGRRRTLSRSQLFACLAPRLRARDVPMLAALALAGRAKRNPALSSFCSPALQVDTPGRRRVRVALDGEVVQMAAPLRYRVRPAALKVIVP